MNIETAFNVGDPIRRSGDSQRYLGKLKRVETRYVVEVDGSELYFHEEDIERAPELTPDEAWRSLAFLVADLMIRYIDPIWPSEYKEIRHQSYRMLGAAGIKVTPEVKAKVRQTVTDMAHVLKFTIRD